MGGAEQWRWSSLWHRVKSSNMPWLSEGPLQPAVDWVEHVNGVETEAELAALRRSVIRRAPFGDETWRHQTAVSLGLESSLRPRGRPAKQKGTKGEM